MTKEQVKESKLYKMIEKNFKKYNEIKNKQD